MPASIPPHESPVAPAYAAAPRRSGLLYAIAVIVALASLVAMAIYLFGGRSALPAGTPAESLATDAQKSLEAARAALDQASRNVMNPAPPPPSASAPDPSTPGATPMPPPEPPRVAASAEPPRPAPRPPAATPAAPAPKGPTVPAKTPAPEPAAAPGAAPPVQVASAERWAQMRNELAACPKSSLIPRCEQRIRERYCEGWWGTVPDCPAGPGGRK